MSRHSMAYLQLAGGMILAGSTVVAGKVATGQFPVFLGSAIRYGLAAAVLLPFLFAPGQGGFGTGRTGWRTAGLLFLQSLLGNFLFSVLLLLGLRQTSATNAGLITSVTPAVAALGAMVLLRERPGGRLLIAAGLAAGGVAITNLAGVEPGSGSAMAGDLLVLGAVVCEALFTLIGKEVSRRLPPLRIAALSLLFGFLTFLPLAVLEGRDFAWGAVSASGWWALVYYGLAGTAGSYVLWFLGLSQVEAGAAAVFTCLMPVSALLLSALVLHESLTIAHAAGGALVVLALLLLGLGQRPARETGSWYKGAGIGPE